MTEVRMIVPISGTRNGQRWPAPGGTVDLPAEEAAAMTAAGMARPVTPVETAAAPEAPETADAPKPRRRKAAQ